MNIAGYFITSEINITDPTSKIYKSTKATTVDSSWTEVHEISDTLSGTSAIVDMYVRSDTHIYFAALIDDSGTNKIRVYESTNSGSSFSTKITVNASHDPATVRIVGNDHHIIVVYESEKFIHGVDGSTWAERDLSSSGLNKTMTIGSLKLLDATVLSNTQAALLMTGTDEGGTNKCTLIYLTAADSSDASNYTVDNASGIIFDDGGDGGANRVIGYSTSAIYVVGNNGGTGIFKSTGLTASSLSSTHGFGTTDAVEYRAGTFVPGGAIYFTGGNPADDLYHYSATNAAREVFTDVLANNIALIDQNIFAYDATNLFAVSLNGSNYGQLLLSNDDGENFSPLTNTVGSNNKYRIKGFGFSRISGKLTVKSSGKFTVKGSGKLTIK